MRAVVAIVSVALTASFVACVPHRASDAPHITGVVINARTLLPVARATLQFSVRGLEPILTGEDGTFDMPETKHWEVSPLGSDDRPGFLLLISAAGFKLQHVLVNVGGPTKYTIKLEPET